MQREMHTRSETIAFLMNAMYTVKRGGCGLATTEFHGQEAFAVDLERFVCSYVALPDIGSLEGIRADLHNIVCIL